MSPLGGPVICPHCGQDVTRPPGIPSIEELKQAIEKLKEQEEFERTDQYFHSIQRHD